MHFPSRRAAVMLSAFFVALSLVFFAFQYSERREIPALADPAVTIELPVLMYHSVIQDSRLLGEWTVSPAIFEQDLAFLQSLGYETVTPTQLVAFINGTGDLPAKPVLITFDDGYYNVYLYALPLLEKYDMQAVISPIGSASEQFSLDADRNPRYAYLPWETICELVESGRFEIGNHTYNMHTYANGRKGIRRKYGEDKAAYKETLTHDIMLLQDKLRDNCDTTPIAFAFPFGHRDEESTKLILEMGFQVLLTSAEKTNILTRDSELPLILNRFNRPYRLSTDTFMRKALGIKR